MAQIIDGKQIARLVRAEVAEGVALLKKRSGAVPHLAVLLVGDDPASQVYVGHKERDAAEVGIDSITHRMAAGTPEAEVAALIDRLNADDAVHGILVQLPLPGHIATDAVIERIDPVKDVDGITPENFGRLLASEAFLEPCTPSGIMELLRRYDVSIKGRSAVIVGRSNIVGKPIALMLMREHATITVCHSRTTDLARRILEADILVAATGKPRMIEGPWIKQGAVVIDVGINRMPDGKLVGDVDFDVACERASLITPVPGGVGLMTRAMLLKNTLKAANKALS
ncbi:MAG: bifunctional methylenetetrahydrofolate dehydrogenase/methenyltetrahydrofolate cyclohydrolase FolD [Deltaproteobacteria bacterium]|nr:bifunctional methylenetetrahydrofolate dehydrogenase/methenyltetrahydrofolate cyclohydrolase FolD [Candidatus Zymogenaceae bacterium]